VEVEYLINGHLHTGEPENRIAVQSKKLETSEKEGGVIKQ
jgi:hypothetical protein